MKRFPSRVRLGLMVLGLLALVQWVLLPVPTAIPDPVFPKAPTGRGPVVLELFTSQGCSSCPPADRLLPALAEQGETEVIPLAFHVDYWDYIGWSDPFASREWTNRQKAYREVLNSRSVYTPQMVVNGQMHATGSDELRIRRLIAQARVYEPVGRPHITLTRSGLRVDAQVDVEVLDADRIKNVIVLAVLFERHQETIVSAGENTGRTLREDYVVRDLERVLSLRNAEANTGSVSFTVDEDHADRDVGVAVLLQHEESRAIVGAAVATVGA